jgi:hypothetical protein
MSLKCYYQYDDRRFCKNWAMHGSRFCTNHQPPSTPDEIAKLSLPPGLRVTELKDVMHILSEALVGSHLGTVSPSKAYSILAELLGFKSDDEDASPGQPAAPRSKPNGSAAARPTGKTRDPAA